MRIIDPQSATLTNIEVLSYLTSNPPRRPPNPPPNSNTRTWIPSPDLRDHNTVVKEIHNYIQRLSPHLLQYPRYTHGSEGNTDEEGKGPAEGIGSADGSKIDTTPTEMDHRLRQLIERLKPYGLTKGEVLMIVNLGVGVGGPAPGEGEGEEEREGQGVEGEVNGMDVDSGPGVNGVLEGEAEAEPVERGEGEVPEEDYGPLALLDTVIEEREERLSDAEVAQVLAIIRESLTRSETTGQSGGNQLEFVHYNT